MIPYPISARLARRLPEWEQDIAVTLRTAELDPIHGAQAILECLRQIQRECQGFMQELDEDACEHCGAPPDLQIAAWRLKAGIMTPLADECPACGAHQPRLQPITVRPIAREDDDIGY